MRRNRKMPRKMSVITERAMHVGGVIVMLFAMVILNRLADSSCTQLMKSIGEKERTLAKLEEARQRESANWESMITPDKLERHLVKHGLSMHYAKPAQTVRMRSDGTPYPGQLSVVKADARVRSREFAMASNSTPAPTALRAAAQGTRAPVAPVRRAAPVNSAKKRTVAGASAQRRR